MPQDVSPAAAQFQFTDVDNTVLQEADAIDQQYVKKGLVMQDPQLQAYLDAVGKRIIGNRPIPAQVQFRFHVLRDPMVQAFALPNGSVYVTTGLFSLLENEAELAGVLGHEAAHVFERHGYLENRSIRKKAVAINILQMTGAGITSLVIYATIFGYSREMEREADSDGLVAMTNAGYDPNAMARAFELLDHDSNLEYEPYQTLYHDHPKLTERREFALQFADAHKSSKFEAGDPKTYLDTVSAAVCFNIQADLSGRRERTAVDRATRLSNMFPDNPKYKVLLADSYSALGAKTKLPSDEERTHHGQDQHRKEYFKMTPEEEQKILLQTPEGQATLHENQAMAEQLYKSVLQSNPDYAAAHRGLGFLYEQEGKYPDAVTEYQSYLKMVSGTSMDRLRIERRLAAVEKMQAPLVRAP